MRPASPWTPTPGRRARAAWRRRALRAAAVLLLTVAPTAVGREGGSLGGATVRGEAGLDTGVALLHAAGSTSATVPLRIVARLELDAPLAEDVDARAVLRPSLTAGRGGTGPELALGLQEAFLRTRTGDADLSLGWERLPLNEMRLTTLVSVEPRLAAGEPRGPLGARAALYAGAWRLRAAVLAVSGDDLAPDGPGAVLSVRREARVVTWEVHALWTHRPAAGATVSTSMGDVVAYGEAWLLADPWTGRGGAGVTGYAGDWLWTAEAGLVAAGGDLRAPSTPTLAASASRALGLDAALDASLALSWPRAADDASTRATVAAAAVSWRRDVGDASLTLVPSLRVDEGRPSGALGLSVRGFF